MLNYVYVVDEKTQEKLKDEINNATVHTLRPAEKVQYYKNDSSYMITYLYPVNYNGDEAATVVIFLIKKESICTVENFLNICLFLITPRS
jgi:hypothetical protein